VQRCPLNQLSNPNPPCYYSPAPHPHTPSKFNTTSPLTPFNIPYSPQKILKGLLIGRVYQVIRSHLTGLVQQNLSPKAFRPHDLRIPRAIREKFPCIALSHSAFRCSAFYGDINDVPFSLTTFISLLSLFISLRSPTTRTVGDTQNRRIPSFLLFVSNINNFHHHHQQHLSV
jgi:hypothetical protein